MWRHQQLSRQSQNRKRLYSHLFWATHVPFLFQLSWSNVVHDNYTFFSWFYVICGNTGRSVVVGRCYTDNDVKSGRFEFSARRLRRSPLLSIYNAHCDAVKSWRNCYTVTFEWSVVVLLLVLPFTWRCFFHNIQVINRQLAFKWIPSETSQYS